MATAADPAPLLAEPAPLLQVRGLCKSYQEKTVLDNLNLAVHPGEIVFLSGPSGSGKSTALRAIANLDCRDAGHLDLQGRPPHRVGFAAWRRHVMYAPQYRVSHNATPRQFFLRALKLASREPLPLDESDRRADAYVDLCLSCGLEWHNVVDQKWNELSGGQAQRAAVMLCIALEPKVLLLDEPSSSCDHQSALLVEKAIVDSGIAAVWVSHDVGQPQRVGGRIQGITDDV